MSLPARRVRSWSSTESLEPVPDTGIVCSATCVTCSIGPGTNLGVRMASCVATDIRSARHSSCAGPTIGYEPRQATVFSSDFKASTTNGNGVRGFAYVQASGPRPRAGSSATWGWGTDSPSSTSIFFVPSKVQDELPTTAFREITPLWKTLSSSGVQRSARRRPRSISSSGSMAGVRSSPPELVAWLTLS